MDDLWELNVQDLEWCAYSCVRMQESLEMLGSLRYLLPT